MKRLILLLFFLLIGCSSLTKEKAETENVTEKIKAEALLGYEYSQMTENTYQPHDTFILPADITNLINVDSDGYGFAYSIFHRTKNGELSEVILSFRGTENNSEWYKDWILGNVFSLQNDIGLNEYRKLRAATPPNIPITVIGHSLGGAIALHVSLREEGVTAYVFNASSRFTRGKAIDNERHSYAEYAEANKILRVFTIAPKWTHSIYSCTFGSPIKNHAQDNLAACLTFCASKISGNAKAVDSIKDNPKLFKDNKMSELACI